MGNCNSGGGMVGWSNEVDGDSASSAQRELGKTVKVGNYSVKMIKVLDQGGFAVVFLAEDASIGTKFALKRILAPNGEAAFLCRREIDAMLKLRHCPNIITLHGSEEAVEGGFTKFLLLMELAPDGHLVGLMNSRLTSPFTEKELLVMMLDVAKGLEAMHACSPPIAHRDIKPENVLLFRDTSTCVRYKLCDFGSCTARHLTPGDGCNIAVVADEIESNTTIQYRAPEQVDLHQGHRISEKVDIWALGVMMYKLMFFKDCFGESSMAIMCGKYEVPDGHRYSEGVLQLLAALLTVDPGVRPDIRRVVAWATALSEGKPVPQTGSGLPAGYLEVSSAPAPAAKPGAAAEPWVATFDNKTAVV